MIAHIIKKAIFIIQREKIKDLPQILEKINKIIKLKILAIIFTKMKIKK